MASRVFLAEMRFAQYSAYGDRLPHYRNGREGGRDIGKRKLVSTVSYLVFISRLHD